MQLFITDYTHVWDQITISEERVVQQLSKVLRAKKGDTFAVQRDGTRIVCEIASMEKWHIIATIVRKEYHEVKDDNTYLAVAMPNKFEKLELIVQKCTELGVQHIVFFPAQHSLLKEISPSKMERLEKISLEASEQSWSWNKIDMTFSKNVLTMCEWKKVFIAHQDWKTIQNSECKVKNEEERILLVGPEWWRHANEEKIFESINAEKISFAENILRTETAAIIWWRIVKTFL